MVCSTVDMIESGSAIAFASNFVVHSMLEADQLTSRINFGLKRPPRA